MLRSILVPLDGSAFAEHALSWAVSLARCTDAALNLAQVHVSSDDQATDAAVRERENTYLGDVARRLAAIASVRVGVALLDGVIVDALRQHAKTVQADLIVMTTHGRGPLSQLWLGSI